MYKILSITCISMESVLQYILPCFLPCRAVSSVETRGAAAPALLPVAGPVVPDKSIL